MIKRKQLYRHDPKNGLIGDCHRTVIACLLDKEPEEVPNVPYEKYAAGESFNHHFDVYLKTQELAIVNIAYANISLYRLLDTLGNINPIAYYILGGEVTKNIGHSVIGRGGQIIWDPSIDEPGIMHADSNGYFWISYLIPISMTEVK